MDTYRVETANRMGFELSRPSAPMTAKQMAMLMEQIATKTVVPTPPRMYPAHLERKAVSIFPLAKRKPTTSRIQVTTNVIRNRRVCRRRWAAICSTIACGSAGGRIPAVTCPMPKPWLTCWSLPSLPNTATGRPAWAPRRISAWWSGARRDGHVAVEPLLGEALEGPIGTHGVEDLVDLCHHARRVRAALVERDAERLEVDGVADLHERQAILDRLLDGRRGAEPAFEVLPPGLPRLGAEPVRGEGGRLRTGRGLRSRGIRAEVERPRQPVEVRGRLAGADRLPGQPVERRDAGCLRRGHLGRRVVIGLAEGEDLLTRRRDRHRANAEVPPPGPGAGGDDVPVRGLERDLHAQPLGDLRPHVDVEALVRPVRLQRGLGRVLRIRGHHDR